MKNIRFRESELRTLRIIEASRTSPRLGVRLLSGEMHGIRFATLKKALDAGLVQQQEGCWFQLSEAGKRRLQVAKELGQ